MAKKKHDSASDADDEESSLQINLSGVKHFFANSRRRSALFVFFLVLIPLILTIYIRLLPQALPATDTWAANSVHSYFRNQITQQVNKQYPNLPSQNRDVLINTQYQAFLTQNKDMINQQIHDTSQYFKTGFQYQENGHTYTFLGDLDSYYYLRQARNIVEKGSVCDRIDNGVCLDTYLFAPLGGTAVPSLHPYAIVFLYHVLKPIMPSINLMQASFFIPTIVACLAAIAAFFIGRRLMNNTAGFFAAMFLAISPLLVTRTLGSDNDIWNIMFPLVILYLVIESFEQKKLWVQILLIGLAGLFVGLFSWTWGGWWYIFLFILVAMGGYLAFIVLKQLYHKKTSRQFFTVEMKTGALVFILFLVISFLSVFLLNNNGTTVNGLWYFTQVFTAPFTSVSAFKDASFANLWPNVFTTVAELNSASIDSIIGQVAYGFHILFALSLLGIIVLLVNRKPTMQQYLLLGFAALIYLFLITDYAVTLPPILYLLILLIPFFIALFMLIRSRETQVDIKIALLLSVWLVGMIFASTQGVRFILLLIPAFVIALGVAIGYLFQYFENKLPEWLHWNNKMGVKLVLIVVFLLILITPISIGVQAGESFVPSITKGWWDSLTKIRLESKPDAIINSWWDFGHWFKYVADRHVTLDGLVQNHPNAHWLGRILQSPDEKESLAILHMLDCGSNNAFVEINKKYNNTLQSVTLLKKMILLPSKEEASALLSKQGFNDAEITTILNYSFCNPPEDYFVTSEDMVGKAGVWAHFGLWDFRRSYIIQNLKNAPLDQATASMQSLGYTAEEAKQLYFETQTLSNEAEINAWISPWPNYVTGNPATCVKKNASTLVECGYGVTIGAQNGNNVIIEGAVLDLKNPTNISLVLGFYDQTTGARAGQGLARPQALVFGDGETLERTPLDNATLGYDVVIAQVNGSYRSIIAAKELSQSTFTKLFYLEGAYTEHFEKFSDITDITGQRIIVWKVNWSS